MPIDPPVLIALAAFVAIVVHSVHSGAKESRDRRRRVRSLTDQPSLVPWKSGAPESSSSDESGSKKARPSSTKSEQLQSSAI